MKVQNPTVMQKHRGSNAENYVLSFEADAGKFCRVSNIRMIITCMHMDGAVSAGINIFSLVPSSRCDISSYPSCKRLPSDSSLRAAKVVSRNTLSSQGD